MRILYNIPRRIVMLLLVLSLLPLSACKPKEDDTKTAPVEDVLTQNVIAEGKIPVTVLVKYAFSINAFEQAVEEKFPQLELIQVGNYTSDRGLVEYERRLEHDDLTDIVMTWPLDVGQKYWADRLIDLSGMSYTASYNTSMLDTISTDGKLYYLPGPAQVRGIVYNKTMFEENGWEVPSDFDGFVALCKEIEASGIRSLVLPFDSAEVLDTAFVGYSYGDCFNTPADAQWLANYNSGTGSLGDHLGTALDTFQRLIDEGLWKPEDLKITYFDRETMLFTRKCAMAEDSVLMARMGHERTGINDKFALMPFFSPDSKTDWARLYMVCYLGLNKHLEEPANAEKYALVQEIMEYICTPEGQEALAADTGAMYSSVKGVPAPDVPEIENLVATLNAGRYAIFPELKNAQDALRKGLAGMIAGTLDKNDVITMVDAANRAPVSSQSSHVLGSASTDFSLTETGNFITDTMRNATDADIALFMDNGKDGKYNGKGLCGRFYAGNLTNADITRVMVGFEQGNSDDLLVVTMTGADLMRTLEYSIPVYNGSVGWFYYFSGLKMTYAPAAEAGSRIRAITTSDGKPIDPEQVYSVAVMKDSVPDDAIRSTLDMKISISDLISSTIQTQNTISPSGDGRFTICEP